MAKLATTWEDQQGGIGEGSRRQQSGNFNRWCRFLSDCGIDDRFLDKFSIEQRLALLSAYAASVRRNEFGKQNKRYLAGSTVEASIKHICSTFRSNLRRDPFLERRGEKSLLLQRQIKGYKYNDKAPSHQKCLPLGVFKTLYSNTESEASTAVGQLTTGALFFGMRFCEYSSVHGSRKTTLLTLRDIRFFHNRKEVPKSGDMRNSPIDSVTITFRRQKNGDKEADITMHRSNDKLCPVRVWRRLVERILRYPKTNLNTTVNTVMHKGKLKKIKSSDILKHIRATVNTIGKDTLGFEAKEVGCHSIRSSFAMLLYLNGVRSDKIMLQGRWRSQAFLTYIRRQVAEFSSGLSSRITDNKEFFTIPDHRDIPETHLMHNPDIPFLNNELFAQDPMQYGLFNGHCDPPLRLRTQLAGM